jgi:hypothetical protein
MHTKKLLEKPTCTHPANKSARGSTAVVFLQEIPIDIGQVWQLNGLAWSAHNDMYLVHCLRKPGPNYVVGHGVAVDDLASRDVRLDELLNGSGAEVVSRDGRRLVGKCNVDLGWELDVLLAEGKKTVSPRGFSRRRWKATCFGQLTRNEGTGSATGASSFDDRQLADLLGLSSGCLGSSLP